MEDESTSQPIDEEEQLEESTSEEVVSETVEESQEPQEEVQETSEETDKPEDEPVEKPSRRENLRIQQLIQKMRQPEETPQKQSGIDYRDALEADDTVYKTLEEDRTQYGQSQYNEGLKRAETIQFHTRLEIDTPRILDKYPQLNKDSDEFNPAVANAVNQMYLSTAGYDPKTDTVQNSNIRYSDYIDGIFEMADEIAGQKVQQSVKNIAKQAANTGIRPDGSTPKRMNLDLAPEQMTDEELNAAISKMLPKK